MTGEGFNDFVYMDNILMIFNEIKYAVNGLLVPSEVTVKWELVAHVRHRKKFRRKQWFLIFSKLKE